MYRAVTLYALEHGAIVSGIVDEEKVIALLDDISIDFRFNPERGASDIYVNGDRAEGRIRTIEVSNCVSRVSSIRQVREKLVAMQQAMSTAKSAMGIRLRSTIPTGKPAARPPAKLPMGMVMTPASTPVAR